MMLPGFVPGLPAAVGSIPQRVGDEGYCGGAVIHPKGTAQARSPWTAGGP